MWFLGAVLALLLVMRAEQRLILRRPQIWARLALFPVRVEREVRLPPRAGEAPSYRSRAEATLAAPLSGEATGGTLLLPAGASLVFLLQSASRGRSMSPGLMRIDAQSTLDPGTLRLRARYAPAPVFALAVVFYLAVAGVASASLSLSVRAMMLAGFLAIVFGFGFQRLRRELPAALERVAGRLERPA